MISKTTYWDIINDHPIIKITLLFVIGIILQHTISLSTTILILSSILLLTLSFILIKKKQLHISSYLIVLLIIISSSFYYSFHKQSKTKYPYAKKLYKSVTVEGTIYEIRLPGGSGLQFVLHIDSAKSVNEFKSICTYYEKPNDTLQNLYKRLLPGQRIRIKGDLYEPRDSRNPGEFDYRNYLLSKDISSAIRIRKLEHITIINSEPSFIKSNIYKIRKYISEKIEESTSHSTAGFIKGILLGEKSDVSNETKEEFINTGVIHVLAVSGLHVGFIYLIIFSLLSRFHLITKYLLTLFGIGLFLMISGGAPSVQRASLMAAILIISKLFDRSTNIINVLCLTGMILLIIDPTQLFNPGFQLSFSAVFSIVLFVPPAQERINKFQIKNSFLKNSLVFVAVSLAAQLGTLPFTIYYFGKVSIVALVSNVLVIPLMGIILASVFLSLFISTVIPVSGFIYFTATEMLIQFLFYYVKNIHQIGLTHFEITNYSIYDGIIFFSVLLIITLIINSNVRTKIKLITIPIIVLNCIVFMTLDNNSLLQNGKLNICFIDIGQGDAILIKFPNEQTALIDAGNSFGEYNSGKRIIHPLLKRLGINKIDYGFVSHMDADHYKGFEYLIPNGIVNNIYKPTPIKDSKKEIKFKKLCLENEIKISYYYKSILSFDNCNIYVLNDTSDAVYKGFDVNNRSGVFVLVYGDRSVLLAGDIEKEAEEYYSKKYKEFLKVDLYKASHHGSKTSSTKEILKFVQSDISVISAGFNNKFNHPSPNVLNDLTLMSKNVFRTDYEGAVMFVCDGENIEHINWKQ